MHGLTTAEWESLRSSLKTTVRDRPLAPGAVAKLLNTAIEHSSLPVLAESLEFKDLSTLRKIANLRDLEPELLQQVTWGGKQGTVSMSVAVELQRIDSIGDRRAAFEQAVAKGLSRTDARRLVRDYLS